MVRAHVKQTVSHPFQYIAASATGATAVANASSQPEEKKTNQKPKVPSKGYTPELGSWPCKIDGCNKIFAREADLKRHQRTTKSHSVPSLYVLVGVFRHILS